MRLKRNVINLFPLVKYYTRRKTFYVNKFLKENISKRSLISYILQWCPLRHFWRETVYFYAQVSCDLQVTNESARSWAEHSSSLIKISSRVKNYHFSKFAIFRRLNRAHHELSFKKNSRKKCFFCADLWIAKVFSMLIILIDR